MASNSEKVYDAIVMDGKKHIYNSEFKDYILSPFECPLCDFHGCVRNSLALHIIIKHPPKIDKAIVAIKERVPRKNYSLYECSENNCSFRSFKRQNYQMHILTHRPKIVIKFNKSFSDSSTITH